MKKEPRRLDLNRETILPMQSTELVGVNGGITPTVTTTTVSSAPCTVSIASILSAVSHVFNTRGC